MKKELTHEVIRQTLHELRETLHALESGDVTVTSFALNNDTFDVALHVDDPVHGPMTLRVNRHPADLLTDDIPFPGRREPMTREEAEDLYPPRSGEGDDYPTE